jgi:hypothetical protein
VEKDIEYVDDQRVVIKSKGGLKGMVKMTFQPEASEAKLTI